MPDHEDTRLTNHSVKKSFHGKRLASSYPFNDRRYETMHDLVSAFAEDNYSWNLAKLHLKRGNINTWLQKIDEFDIDVQVFGILRNHQDPDLQLCLLIAKFSHEIRFYYKSYLIDIAHLIEYFQKYQSTEEENQESRICRAYLNGTLKKWFDLVCEIRGRNDEPLLGTALSLPTKIRELDLSPMQVKNTILIYLSALLDMASAGKNISDIGVGVSHRLEVYVNDKKYQEGLVLIDIFDEILDNSRTLGAVREKIQDIYKNRIRQEQQDAILDEGIEYLKNNRIDDAIRIIDIAIGINQNYAKAWDCKGSALAGLLLYEEALIAYNRSIELEPENARTWSNRGIILCRQGRYKEAVDAYYRAIEIDPEYSSVLCNVGCALCNMGMYEEAVKALKDGLKAEPANIKAWCHQGNAHYHLGRFEETVESYYQVQKLNPTYLFPWKFFADALFNLHRYEEALIAADHILQSNPDDIMVLNMKGFSLCRLSRFTEAIEAFSRIIDKNKKDSNAWIMTGIAYAGQGNFHRAIEMYDQALKIDDMNADSWTYRGEALFHLGRVDDAVISYNRSIAIKPLNRRVWVNMGDIQLENQLYDEAIGSYRKSVILDPDCAKAWKKLGNTLCLAGKEDEGKMALREAYERDPGLFMNGSPERKFN